MLIDAFLYFNEKELVELRIKYLNNLVDYFVIVEADITHQGKKKDWNFPKILERNLKEFSSKIQYHQLNIDPEKIKKEESWIIDDIKGDDAHRVDNFQRNYIKTACKKFSNEDILIISDIDEIPSKQKLEFIKSCDFKKIAPIALEQHLFHIDCNFLRLKHTLFFFPPYNMAGIKPSDRNLLICPVEVVVLFVAFKMFINRKGVFIICL